MSEAITQPPIPSDPYSLPLADIDVSNPELYEADSHWAYFERLRAEAPAHYCKTSSFGLFWSVSRLEDIMAVDKDHETFSSYPGIVIGDQPPEFTVKQFIAMDPPRHDSQRQGGTPAVSPASLATMEPMIRQRYCRAAHGRFNPMPGNLHGYLERARQQGPQ
jgi:cytochrome P450